MLLHESEPKSTTKKPNNELEKQQSGGLNPTKPLQVYSRRREPVSTPETVQKSKPETEPGTDSFPSFEDNKQFSRFRKASGLDTYLGTE